MTEYSDINSLYFEQFESLPLVLYAADIPYLKEAECRIIGCPLPSITYKFLCWKSILHEREFIPVFHR